MRGGGGPVTIVGAGVAGLALAERLSSSGRRVTVVEREDSPGGLARTFEHDGFRFDIGPHRFHTVDAGVQAYLEDVLEGRIARIPRSSSVYLGGRYHDWPLTLPGVTRLPPRMLLSCLPDLFRRRGGAEPASFAGHIISRYGRNLYRHFFRDYTRKFTGLDPEELHTDWAAAGVDRAVIDRRVRADSLASLARSLLLPRPVSTSFIYPAQGGIQAFADILAARVTRAGSEIMLSTRASGIETANGCVKGVTLAGGGFLEAEEVYWSAPLNGAVEADGLAFMDTVVFDVALDRRRPFDYQWCYFGEPSTVFSRLSIPRNFSEDMAPKGADSIVVEISCRRGDEVWEAPESILPRVLDDLERVGAIDPGGVVFSIPHRIPETYPLYSLDYRERLSEVSPPAGLHLLGRCGSFWYNNMDHSISQALAMSRGELVRRDFWKAPGQQST